MPPTRPVPRAGRAPARPPTLPLPGLPDGPDGVARCAASLEALLGDPRDRANPCGRAALWSAGPGGLPAPPPGLPGTGQTRPPAGQLARALRPLFRRDLALTHAWSIRPLLSAPLPDPAAALFGPAALLAATGGVLRGVAGIVAGLSRYEPGARQWRPVLAAAFADLLACESLTALALLYCPDRGADAAGSATVGSAAGGLGADLPGTGGPGAGGLGTVGCAMGGPGVGSLGAVGRLPQRQFGEVLAAVVGYVVPQLAGELLGDLELVLHESGFDGDTLERRTLAKILRDRASVRADWTAAGAAQARLVRGLDPAGGVWPDPAMEPAALFRITEAACAAVALGTDRPRSVAAAPAAAADRPSGTGEPGTTALARVRRGLVTEQRALRAAWAATAVHDPADPAARALVDRQALLLLAASVLGVREAAAGARLPFLGETGWALSALGRIAGRLGLPLPGSAPDPQPGVWDELARRAANGLDCDLYATRLPW